jgi:hypothetical protein
MTTWPTDRHFCSEYLWCLSDSERHKFTAFSLLIQIICHMALVEVMCKLKWILHINERIYFYYIKLHIEKI